MVYIGLSCQTAQKQGTGRTPCIDQVVVLICTWIALTHEEDPTFKGFLLKFSGEDIKLIEIGYISGGIGVLINLNG